MDNWLFRTKLLIGEENIQKLESSTIAIFGLGGVGSYAAETLVRAGIGNIVIIDNDKIDITNINRQLLADTTTIGNYKIDVAYNRYKNINPKINIKMYSEFFDITNCDKLISNKYDYIIDAIDSISSKLLLIEKAYKNNIPIISCMGTGNKLNPTELEISDIYKTSVCPLAKIIRKNLSKMNIDKLKVIYSKEKPKKIISDENVISSISFVPSIAGILMASEVIKDLINYSIK